MPRSLGVIALVLAGAAPAYAAEAPSPWWRIGAEATPSNLPPEHEGEKGHEGQGAIVVVASDLGDWAGQRRQWRTDRHQRQAAGGVEGDRASPRHGQAHEQRAARSRTLQCTFTGTLYPYERLAISIKVKVEEPAGTVTTLPDEMSVQGGGAPRGVLEHPAADDQRRADAVRGADERL